MDVLTFSVGGERYGIRACDVIEILPAMTMARVPGVSPVIEGVVNLRGKVVPVLDMRARFGEPSRPMAHTDHLIIARASGRDVALRADRALDLVPIEEADLVRAADVSPSLSPARGGARPIAGVAKLPDGVVIIHDPAAFLSQAEAAALDQGIAAAKLPGGGGR